MAKQLIIGLLWLCCTSIAWAQTTVSGTVRDVQGEPLIGVNIRVKSTGNGAVTDLDGKYRIQVPDGDAVLVFSYTGFLSQEIEVGVRSIIDLTLEEDIAQLSEVVVVGYGSVREQDLSSSLAKLGDEQIANVPATYSFDGAIQGKAAGVNITTSSATPGAAINVNVRGTTSIGASSQPLYIVDGIPLVASNNSALNNNIQPVNPLADINPNDIESITILKDASAAAIYGSRGANGVVLITTKRGSAGETKVNVGYNVGVSQISNVPELMSTQEWIGFLNTAAEFDGLGENYFNDALGDPNDASLPTYNAYDYIFRTGITHNADLSLRGGDAKTQFFISGNFFDQEGIQVGQGFQRASGRINLDHSLNEKVGIGTSILMSRTQHQRTINENDEYGVVVNAQAWDPTAPLVNSDGSYTNPFDYNGWWALENPLIIANDYRNFSKTSRVLASTFVTYDILENLQFKSSWSVDFNTLNEESFVPAGTNQTDIGLGSYATFEELAWLTENTLSYTNTFADKHNVSAVLGYTVQESRSEFSDISASGFPTNELTKLALAANITGASSSATAYGLMSFFGRVNYSYDSKYLFTATVRSDGSSRFGVNNRFGTFPSASLGWNLHEEGFWESLRSVVSTAKLRGSYGITGNQEIGNFSGRGVWSLNSPYNGVGGSQPSSLENPSLSWERTEQLDIGVDLGLFDNRLNVVVDYFQKNTDALLSDADIPGTTGFFTVTSNIGEIKNSGWEFSLNSVNVQSGDFTWSTNLNATYIQNEVVDVVNNGAIISRNFILLEGQPLSTFNLIKFTGVDPTTGDATYEDLNSDGIIDLDDRQPFGSGMPDWFGGITNSVSYKGLNLSVFFQFVQGNEIFNQSRHAYENYGSLRGGIPYGNSSRRSLNHWSQPGDITDIPRPSLASIDETTDLQWQRFSTQYLEDGSFIRLKNIRLGYSLPKAVVEKAGLSNVNLYAQGQNLYTWTRYLGFDPEITTNTASQESLNTLQGEDFGTLGQARTVSLGVSIDF